MLILFMEQKKSWVRKSNYIPEERRMGNKYNFSFHLQEVGDWVETFPMSFYDRMQMNKAAHIWAYRKKWSVSAEQVAVPDGIGMRITLTKKYRKI